MHNRVVWCGVFCVNIIDKLAVGRSLCRKLLDYEMSSNVGIGNGQLEPVVMHTLFQSFNPSIQLKKFDEKGVYIRKWILNSVTEAYGGSCFCKR
jgi:deoxyribodipyrimidine photo-lyase